MEKIKIGRITGAQGLRGEIKLYHDSGDEAAIRRLTSLFLSPEADSAALRIESLRFHRRTPILKLSGIDDRNAAELLIGSEVYASIDDARPDEKGAWLVSDLVGLEVRIAGSGDEGEVRAAPWRIKNVIGNPAHDILEIETEEGLRLLPFVDAFVREIDTKTGLVIIMPPENWLE